VSDRRRYRRGRPVPNAVLPCIAEWAPRADGGVVAAAEGPGAQLSTGNPAAASAVCADQCRAGWSAVRSTAGRRAAPALAALRGSADTRPADDHGHSSGCRSRSTPGSLHQLKRADAVGWTGRGGGERSWGAQLPTGIHSFHSFIHNRRQMSGVLTQCQLAFRRIAVDKAPADGPPIQRARRPPSEISWRAKHPFDGRRTVDAPPRRRRTKAVPITAAHSSEH
jgi:hypothetical protein